METIDDLLRRIVREEVASALADLKLALTLPTSEAVPPSRPAAAVHMTTKEAADYSGRHPKTISEALNAGELHGSQRVRGGNWTVRTTCLEAWMAQTACEHQPQRARQPTTRPGPVPVDSPWDKWLLEQEVAERIGFTVSTLQSWRTLKKGPPYVRIGRQVRYDEKALADWQKAQPTVDQ